MKKGLTLSLLFSFVFCQTAFADTISTSFSAEPANKNAVKPSIFLYEAKPGSVIEDSILIKNTSNEEKILALYATDGFTSSDGNPTFKTNGEEMAEIGSWIGIENAHTFQPQETKKISFSIKIPEDTEENTYKGGFALEEKFNSEATVQTALRTIKNIEIKVTQDPQDIPKMESPAPAFEPTPFFWITLAIFLASMTYVIITSKKTNGKKHNKTS